MKIIFTILVFITTISNIQAQNKEVLKIDSLKNELSKAKEDTNKVKLFRKISNTYRRSNYKLAMDYMKKSETLATTLNYNDGISIANYGLGNIYMDHSDFNNALKCFNKAIEIEKAAGHKASMANLLHNIANVYLSMADYAKGIKLNLQALKLFEEVGDTIGTANCHTNIAYVYEKIGDTKKSMNHTQKAMKLYTETGAKWGIAVSLVNIGSLYSKSGDFAKSKPYFTKALEIYTELNQADGMDLALINLSENHLDSREYKPALDFALKALQISKANDLPEALAYDYKTISKIYYRMSLDEKLNDTDLGEIVRENDPIKMAEAYIDSSLSIIKSSEMLSEYSEALELKAKINAAAGDYKNAYENYKLFKVLNDSVFNIEKDKKITQSAMQYDFDKKEAKIKAENEKQSIRQRNIRNSIAGGLVGTLIFLVVVYRQRNKISKEKARSEALLLNILPYEVAEELKEKGSADAKNFDEVTVLFTDFKGFTQLSEKLTPTELVSEINHCFSAFDYIMQKHGIEKIKTIGDSYMAAGGIPKPNKTHSIDVVNAALEIQKFMHNLKKEKEAQGKLFFEIRIGIHTGTVVAGIVGVKKFAYDIWGDTVNTASRMESSGEAGKINISGTTYEFVKEKFKCEYRGKIQAKGKGEIDMYFVEDNI